MKTKNTLLSELRQTMIENVPYIPGLNRLPEDLKVYKIIWKVKK
jgi:hypothetical protein